MTTQHTPQSQGRAQQPAGTPDDMGRPPPIIAMNQQPQVVMSPDQFRSFMDFRGAHSEEDFPNVSSVAVKLPTFWTHDPDLWFLQTEAVFASRQPPVTRDATKFNHAVTALPSDALNACKNIIRLPATTTDLSLIHI